ncbi:MAG: NADH-quinone oxidoreductase subunit NuoE [Firmicutes bacterium]|nr:NADH-quinone oxidoreductase subunit NuoE [Bacillota bacterium]
MELLKGEKEAILKHTKEIFQEFEAKRENLIPILQEVQKRLGYLPRLAMQKIAEFLGIPPVDVFALATFYNQFRLNPPGKNEIKVCMGTACYMVGGKIALESFERRLNIKEGQTTPDREYSLERVACVGCCTLAPVVVVNEQIEGKVSPTRVDGIILSLQGEKSKEGEEANEDTKEKLKGEKQ